VAASLRDADGSITVDFDKTNNSRFENRLFDANPRQHNREF